MNDLSIFQFEDEDIRAGLTDSGDLYFVAADVCRILGIRNVSNALEKLESDEKDDITLSDVTGRRQGIRVVNEPGLYRLIFRSDKPKAKKFQRFVFHDLLPAIRKHGGYISPTATPEQVEVLQSQIDTLKSRLDGREKHIRRLYNELADRDNPETSARSYRANYDRSQ